MTYKHLKKWTLPGSYCGEHWDNYFAFLGRSRDSSELEESNFAEALAAIGGETDEDENGVSMVAVVRESHWACGWVEWIAIHESNTEALAKAEAILERLEIYPILNEDDFSEREQESANSIWESCYSAAERVEYIREHRSQFDFHDWSEVRAVVRGDYFNGYASELIG